MSSQQWTGVPSLASTSILLCWAVFFLMPGLGYWNTLPKLWSAKGSQKANPADVMVLGKVGGLLRSAPLISSRDRVVEAKETVLRYKGTCVL